MPEFALPDQDGTTQTLSSIVGPKGALIVFYRSIDWCPYCKSQIMQLDVNRNKFSGLGVGVVAISNDSPARLHEFALRGGVHVPLLSDSKHELIAQAGVLNIAIPKDSAYYGSAYPSSFVLDAKGIVTAKYFENHHGARSTPSDILAAHFDVEPALRTDTVEGKELKATISSNLSIVSVGQNVGLTLDIDMKPGMHVYSPSAQKGYIPIEWKWRASPASSPLRVSYPNPEIVWLKPLNSTAAVYRGHVRLKGAIKIADDEALSKVADSSGFFKIEASLRYQACDDRTCYAPRSLPLKWVFQLAGPSHRITPTGALSSPSTPEKTKVVAASRSSEQLSKLKE
jgi:peroxiredoxin